MTPHDVASHAFKTRDAASYDTVAVEYETFAARLSTPFAARAVSLARVAPGARVLDVGTGTGIVALEAATRVGPHGRVVGIDLSAEMLAAARARAVRAGLAPRVEFQPMDAEALAFGDRSFDAVVSLFALLHFPNPRSAVEEMFRVLWPGGEVAVGVGGAAPLLSPDGVAQLLVGVTGLVRRVRGIELTAPYLLNDMVNRHFPVPHTPEETSLATHRAGRVEALATLMRRAGFIDVRSSSMRCRSTFATPEEFYDVQRTFSSVARKRLAVAPPERVAELREEFLEACGRALSRGGALVYPVAALFTTARRPPNGGDGQARRRARQVVRGDE